MTKRRTVKFLSQQVVLFLSHGLVFILKIFLLLLCPVYGTFHAMVIIGWLDVCCFFPLEVCFYLISKQCAHFIFSDFLY